MSHSLWVKVIGISAICSMHIHYKNKIVKTTNLLVSTVEKISWNCNLIDGHVGYDFMVIKLYVLVLIII